jgi:ABC-type transporter MlaC component
MQIRKTLIALLAVAIAIAFSPVQELQAASLLSPGSQPAADNVTYTVKAKKAAKKKGKKAKKAKKGKKAKSKSKGPGRCGVGKYWKKGKCEDASSKK